VNRVLSEPAAFHISSPPVQDDVLLLARFLRETLPAPWEIYERPFLNGDYPSLAALHPSAGLTLFDVHAWDLRHYRRKQSGRYQRYTQRMEQKTRTVLNPVRRAEHYIENLLNLYAPFIGESVKRDRRTLAAFRVALYFPLVNTNAARSFCPLAPGRGLVFGRDALETGDLSLCLPRPVRPNNAPLPADWLAALRFWLAPPPHLAAQGSQLVLTEDQRRHVTPAPGHHQRLHGVAGSGKTLVIAQRAANLAAAGKRVLVISFNVTLWQYIRRLVSQTAVNFPWSTIEFHHFHGFCKNFLIENNVEWPLVGNRRPQQRLDEMTPELVMDLLQGGHNSKERRYDAILIDEGQDFLRTYYDTLCHFLTANDEVLFVADRRQNVYLRDDSWLEKMSNTKFRGRWRELKTSYRLPPLVVQEANRFAELFLPTAAALPVAIEATSESSLSARSNPATLVWHNVTAPEQAYTLATSRVQQLLKEEGVKPADIVILTPNQREGWALVRYLAQQNLAVNHVLAEDDGGIGRKRERYRKRTFAEGDLRLKVSTIHSFKGWELNHVILLTPEDDAFWEAQSPYLFYVAMTRTRQSLVVLNRHPAYRAYGEGWGVYGTGENVSDL
jgi:hypothetical protein